MFSRPAVLWLLLLLPLIVMPAALAIRNGRWLAGVSLGLLRAMLFVALVVLLAGLRVPASTALRNLSVLVAIDQSRSIAPDQADWMRRQVAALRSSLGPVDQLGVLGFGRDVKLLAPLADPRTVGEIGAGADPGATDIAAALTAAGALFAVESEKRIVLLSDGNQTQGDAQAETLALADEGVRVFTFAPPRSETERIALIDLDAPGSVRSDQRFAFRIGIESQAGGPIDADLKLLRDGAPVGSQSVRLKHGLNRFELPYRFERAGAYVMSVEMSAPQPVVTVNPRAETALSVLEPPRVLVVSSAPPESVIGAFRRRNYRLDIVSPRGLPENASDYLRYQLVVLGDVSSDELTAGAQQAFNRYVADLGGGLIVTGEALRDEKFRGSTLEKTLPVTFRVQPPPPSREPIAVYLCIDRSNSMSYDSRYPAVRNNERIRYAKAAAIALLRQLDDTDYAGVAAFDSQPYVLAHLEPLGDNRSALENRIERLEPGGGTDFKEALEIAQREILDGGIPVRQVFLLTDGDTNRQYHDHDSLIADFARDRIPVSTIRIGPDLANLRLLQDFAQATNGTFYRVQDIEKLPLLLVGLTREAMNRRKGGRTRIEAGGHSAILAGIEVNEIPPIDYFASTVLKDGAQAPLKVTRGRVSTPLLAAWQYGLGRAAVFAADPDSLATLSWIRWNRYAEFWSQLATWAMRHGDPGPFSMQLRAAPDGSVRIDAEKADSAPVSNLVCRITGAGTALDVPMTQAGASLYFGEVVPLPRGKYAATLMLKAGDTERVLLQREFASVGSLPADAAELRIHSPNYALLKRLATSTGGAFDASAGEIVKRSGATVTVYRSAEPYVLPLVFALFLAEVFVRRRYLGD